MLKKFKPLLLASALLLSISSPALANTPTTTSSNISQEVVDVKSTVEKGKVVTTIKYKDGTETVISTSLPNAITSTANSVTAPVAKPVDPAYLPPEDYSSKIYGASNAEALNSNNDETRRNSVQSTLGMTFSGDDEVYQNSNSAQGDGSVSSYMKRTSIEDLKSLGNYATNANRQELIQYAIRTGDWQPYRKLEYKKSPLFFYLTDDNKLEYSKVYWAKFISGEVNMYRENLVKFHQGELSLTKSLVELESEHKKRMQEYIENWKSAKGPALYVIGFNNNDDYAKEWGVEKVPNAYFNSPYNHPLVLSDGRFAEAVKK